LYNRTIVLGTDGSPHSTQGRLVVRIDLNADLGESFGIFVVGDDAGLIPHISSANVAGFHGGDHRDPANHPPGGRAAVAVGVTRLSGLAGFGRREMRMADWEVEDAMLSNRDSDGLPRPKVFQFGT
jgi:lactam utilization protein B